MKYRLKRVGISVITLCLLFSTFLSPVSAAIVPDKNSTDSNTALTVIPKLSGASTWYYDGMTEIINSKTNSLIGMTYRYKDDSGKTITMINPGSIGDWAEAFGGDRHQVIDAYSNGTITTYEMKPSSKDAYNRLDITDIIVKSKASYKFSNGKLYVTPPETEPVITKFKIREEKEHACYILNDTVNIDIEVQEYLSNPEGLKYVEVYYEDTNKKVASTLKKWTDVETDKNGKAILSVPYKITSKGEVNFYIRAYDKLNRFDKDTNELQNKVGLITPVGLKISVCGQYKPTDMDGNIPYFDTRNWLYSPNLAEGQLLFRVDDTTDATVLGPHRYPTLYDGKFSDDARSSMNKSFTVEHNFKNTGSIDRKTIKSAYQAQPFYHLIPENRDTARNVIEIENVSDEDLKTVYNGNPEYMRENMPTHEILNEDRTESYGFYYYIREIAYNAGGYADNLSPANQEAYEKINPTLLRFKRTDYPDIEEFKINKEKVKVGDTVSFAFNGFEYVSSDRNKADTTITVKKDGVTYGKIHTNLKSDKKKKNPSKKNQEEAGFFSTKKTGGIVVPEEGLYTAELFVEDSVKRSVKKTIEFCVSLDGECNDKKPPGDLPPPKSCDAETIAEVDDCLEPHEYPDPPDEDEDKPIDPIKPEQPKKPNIPEIGKGGVCTVPHLPDQITEPFIYKIDLITDRIEGETVEQHTITTTPVTVSRADYTEERQEIKYKLKEDVITNQNLKKDCQKTLKDLENLLATLLQQEADLKSDLAATQAAYSACLNSGWWDEDGHYHRPDCSSYPPAIAAIQAALSKVQQQIADTREKIRLSKITLVEYDDVINAIIDYINHINELEVLYAYIPTSVDLTFNGDFVKTKYLILKEGQQRILVYKWILPKDGVVKGHIDPKDNYPVCNGKLHPCETTNDNNEKETPIYISTFETVDACSLEGSTSELQGIVRTITTKKGTEIKKEYAKATLEIDKDEKNRRAGYGFYYKINTSYINEDVATNRSTNGIDELKGFKPEILASHLPYAHVNWVAPVTHSTQINKNTLKLKGYEVPEYFSNETKAKVDNKANAPYKEELEWELPQYSVEKYSGNVFEGNIEKAQGDVNHDSNDVLLDGGRKWYLDFYQPDGTYSYDTIVTNIGVNKLTLCTNGKVEVKGTPIGDENGDSDFIFRFVDAEKPFPGGTGWNWINFEGIITNIKDWWLNWMYPDPKDIPANYHETEYLIEHKTE